MGLKHDSGRLEAIKEFSVRKWELGTGRLCVWGQESIYKRTRTWFGFREGVENMGEEVGRSDRKTVVRNYRWKNFKSLEK